jgi:spore coat polysaccharide biosynthesis predicted glycosyltransferase SpsG/CMP-N-acetylneuraminic acid synthetase
MSKIKTLVIIPARGGSKTIPRKNLRPLNGKPLIFYAIKACLNAKKSDRIVVSTEDNEISLFSKRFGADVLKRPNNLSNDQIPLDPVIVHAVEFCELKWNEKYNNIVTVQPTCPLLLSSDIDTVVTRLRDEPIDTIISVCIDKHLRWKIVNNEVTKEYDERVNRQFLPDVYRETGAIIACRRSVLKENTRIGKEIALHIIEPSRSIDIDTYHDLWLCELILKRKKIVIAVAGNSTIGMGHVYRTLMLANELIQHEIVFVCKEGDHLAINHISQYNYKVFISSADECTKKILSLNPDMVINDILDTTADYIVKLKRFVPYVINFEDMGTGAETADLVINALYPYNIPKKHIVVGPKYFCLRDEFLHITKRTEKNSVNNILISFGGVDEGNLTCRLLPIVWEKVKDRKIEINIVLGPGYSHHEKLSKIIGRINTTQINVIKATKKISEYMNIADLAITSAGRTVYELCSLEVPTMVISQNVRETKHTFASSENGFINLGLHSEINDKTIMDSLTMVLNDRDLRKVMIEKMNSYDLREGKKRVIEMINGFLR